MFAINHAATALVIKKIYPDVPISVLLVSAQFIEIIWVVLNFLGIEKVTTENKIGSVSDVHLEYMPYSHSVISTGVIAAGAWLICSLRFKELNIGIAVVLGLCSHIVLDFISHARDIVLAPFLDSRKFGLGLYEKPVAAFVVETIYGIFCWWIYGGSIALFWIIVGFNLANVSFFIKTIPGPEKYLAHRPSWITGIVALQIVVTGVLVGVLS